MGEEVSRSLVLVGDAFTAKTAARFRMDAQAPRGRHPRLLRLPHRQRRYGSHEQQREGRGSPGARLPYRASLLAVIAALPRRPGTARNRAQILVRSLFSL